MVMGLGEDTDVPFGVDTSLFIERGVSVDARVLHARAVEVHPATPGMRSSTGSPIITGQTDL